eukprot:scaffold69546_cov54-Phaeocystis_antarctica.AAC.1
MAANEASRMAPPSCMPDWYVLGSDMSSAQKGSASRTAVACGVRSRSRHSRPKRRAGRYMGRATRLARRASAALQAVAGAAGALCGRT